MHPEPSATSPQAWGTRSVSAASNFGIINTGDQPVFIMEANTGLISPCETSISEHISNLPRPGTEVFLGRDETLENLQNVRARTARQVIFGLGGVGKTELALQYAEGQRRNTQLVWWVNAETPDQIESGFAALAIRLTSNSGVKLSRTEAAEWAIAWLNSNDDWLLILDNVSEPKQILGLLAKIPDSGHVIITTRRNVRWPRDYVAMHLSVLSTESAIDLVTRVVECSTPSEIASIQRIVETLGCLPLALDQASAVMWQTKITPSRFIEKLSMRPVQVLGSTTDGHKEQEAVLKVWDVTMAALKERSPEAVECLYILAFYLPDDIPREIVGYDDSEEDFDALLGLLSSFSMVTLTPESVHIHRLVRDVLLMGASSDSEIGRALRDTALSWLCAHLPLNPADHIETWPLLRRIIPHFESVAAFYPMQDRTEEFAATCSSLGLFEGIQGNYEKALHFKSMAADVVSNVLGEGPATVIALNNLGIAYRDVSRRDKAIELQRNALEMAQDCGVSEKEMAIILGQLGRTCGEIGEKDDARKYLERSITLAEQAFGKMDAETAIRLADLGNFYQFTGNPMAAFPLLKRALYVTKKALHAEHPLTAIRMRDVANVYKNLGKFEEAANLAREALRLLEISLGPKHRITDGCMELLSRIYRSMGNLEASLELAERSLAASVAPRDTSVRLIYIATLLSTLGRDDEALEAAAKVDLNSLDDQHAVEAKKMIDMVQRTASTAERIHLQ